MGREGDDTIGGSSGEDDLRGGPGIDTLYYGHLSSGAPINLADRTAVLFQGRDTTSTVTSFENVVGTSGNDAITGGPGPKLLNRRDGEDNFGAYADGDTFIGGPGYDTLSYLGLEAGITADLRAQTASSGTATDSFSTIEEFWGTDDDDAFTGSRWDGKIIDWADNDLLIGNGGDESARFDPDSRIRGVSGGIGRDEDVSLLEAPPWDPHPFLTSALLLLWIPALVTVLVALMQGELPLALVATAAPGSIAGGAWACLLAIGRHARYNDWLRNQPGVESGYVHRPIRGTWYRNEPRKPTDPR